jgi:hypothetical protein
MMGPLEVVEELLVKLLDLHLLLPNDVICLDLEILKSGAYPIAHLNFILGRRLVIKFL